MKSSGMRSLTITPQVIRVVALSVMWIGIGGYFGWQLYNLFRPPFLVITHPFDDILTEEQTVEFSGRAHTESDTLINGEEVDVADNGIFRTHVPLQEGMNVFEVR